MNKKSFLFLLFLFFTCKNYAQITVADLPKAVKEARPGDTILVKNGTYQNVELALTGKGTAAKPIVVKAQTAGQVLFTGTSSLRIAGNGLEINGFYFTAGYAPKGGAIEYRSGGEVANHCRITNC